MVLREGALPGVGGHHRHVHQLGKLPQLFRRLSPQYSLSRINNRAFGGQKGLDSVGYVAGVTGASVALDRAVIKGGLVNFRRGDVAGYLDHDRAAPARPQEGVGSTHHFRDTFGLIYLRHPLGYAPVGRHGIEIGRLPQSPAGGAAWYGQDGRGLGIGMGNAGEGIFDTGARLSDKNSGTVSVGHAGIAVCHIHRGTLGTRHDGFDAGDGGGLDQCIGRKAEKVLRTFHFQYVRYGCVAVHFAFPPSCVLSGLFIRPGPGSHRTLRAGLDGTPLPGRTSQPLGPQGDHLGCVHLPETP